MIHKFWNEDVNAYHPAEEICMLTEEMTEKLTPIKAKQTWDGLCPVAATAAGYDDGGEFTLSADIFLCVTQPLG